MTALLLGAALVAPACGDSDKGASTGATTTVAKGTTTITKQAPVVDDMVDVGGHRLHLVCQGTAEPMVLIEMGTDQASANWLPTLDRLSADHKACVYERAGNGDSDRGPESRTAAQVGAELESLLNAAKVDQPFILVSHSLGGMYAQWFAAKHPERIAGLVFVDPRLAEYQQQYRALLSPSELGLDAASYSEAAGTVWGREIVASDESAAQVIEAGPVPDVPLLVLTAGVAFEGQPQADIDLWRSTHEHLAAQAKDGKAVVVDGADHEIFRSHGPTVVDAVKTVADAARWKSEEPRSPQ